VPDECEVASGSSTDCNSNGIPDECELDCNGDGNPDSCDPGIDCNANGVPDSCDVSDGTSEDCDRNGVPDECESDCDGDGTPDACDLPVNDCNANGIEDICDLNSGISTDCDSNGNPDECDPDCNGDGTPDACIPDLDCNANGVHDSCDLDDGTSADCNGNAIPDECDIASGEVDCNADGVPDACQISDNPNLDLNSNDLLDECECFFSNYCTGMPNTTGLGGTISFSGSAFVSFNDLTLVGTDVPTNQFGIFYYGPNQVNGGAGVPFGEGMRCVGGQTVRLPVVNTGPSGLPARNIDNTQAPHSQNLQPGSTWNFQFWFRDPLGGPAGWNLTDALSITFCP
jgi:hypothetical protein